MKTIRCTDCYEENRSTQERCSRCGRLLEGAGPQKIQERQFEIQHADAPNVMSERNQRKQPQKQNTAW
ncbi:hypothetical protein LSG31_22270 [Fodinisporobacter ferrooxydans]|uniref:Uncharacterized protein n=1 Tax=Fodinisporobacter ferrooxydans TaxID=2901836 RepID=A0ABY4CJH4_9BACL|nr:hypothetical protein LSG31_22270 [Alicyclobacillaceae bacterium MYW30-H2]